MSPPISTPPNAIAYATRRLPSRQLLITGTVVSVLGLALVSVLLIVLAGAGVLE